MLPTLWRPVRFGGRERKREREREREREAENKIQLQEHISNDLSLPN
jgi:hypothetical protein